MRKPTWWVRLAAIGRILTVLAFAVLAVFFLHLGISDLRNRAEPIYWGTFTQHGCEPPEFGWEPCRVVGDWLSEDGLITKRNVYLDGEIPPAGSVRASFRPTGEYNDEQNNVVHTEEFTGPGWLPWAGAAGSAGVGLGYALWWWTRTGRRVARWLDGTDLLP